MEQDSRKIIAKLKRDGFELVKVKGSHHKLKKDGKVVIVPHPKKIFRLVQHVLSHNKQVG
ncbi:YcfA-like protein [Bartonella vinsonii]|uniref:YcfA-like protein n=1 Tax=Bartonella vinsonii TaxID=33047 RepID=A0A3S5C069_BARVI|nr:YcfA-like protein [Bartonella vinsonii]